MNNKSFAVEFILDDGVLYARRLHLERLPSEIFGKFLSPMQTLKIAAMIMNRVDFEIIEHLDGLPIDPIKPEYSNLEKARKEWDDLRSKLSPKVFARDGAICADCGVDEYLSIDHIIPLSRGGAGDLENLQVLCRSCNSRKGDR